MRLVFFGGGVFSLPTIRALATHLVMVVTQPDRPAGRGMKLQPSPAKLLAQELGLPVETPERSRSPEFVETLRKLDADALVVASYGQILSQAVLDSSRRGGINLHGSILPEYRGAAPIQRCILDGRAETGITLMQMDKGMDTGDIIDLAKTLIGPDETYGQLQDRLAVIAADLAQIWMPRIASGDYQRIPQDSSIATLAPKVAKEEAALSVTRPTVDEFNRYRAFTPNPGATLATRLGNLKILKANHSNLNGEPGEILAAQDGLVLGFQTGAIELLEVQPEGKKRVSGRDFANGARLKPGERLV